MKEVLPVKRICSLLVAVVLAVMLVGCGSSAASTDSVQTSSTYNETAAVGGDYWAADEAADSYSAPAETPRGDDADATNDARATKMVYSGYMELETQDFDTASGEIEALVAELGGYFQQSSVSNGSGGYRYGSYIIRVPAAAFESFFRQAGEMCHMTYKSASADNISESYYDTEARLETARIKLERLQTLLAKATTMEDIITIESAISETEWDIESLSGTLRHYDALVDYATIEVSLREVYKLSGQDEAATSFGGRLGQSFVSGLAAVGDTLEDFAVWLAYSWVWLAVLAIAVVLLVRLIRKKRGGKPFTLRRRKRSEGAEKE